MRCFTGLLCLSVLGSACGSDRGGPPAVALTSPTSESRPSASPEPHQVITVGEKVETALTFHGESKHFELVAPLSGTLIARVSYERSRGVLQLDLGDQISVASPPDGSIVGKLPVAVAQRYRVRVADGAPWDYDDLFLPFVLTTSIE